MVSETGCYAVWLGTIEYARALELQHNLCRFKKHGFEHDVLLLLEHPPTITLGRNGNWSNLLISPDALQARGVSFFETDRGGDVTFHGPGQLVGYPILKLGAGEQDVHGYMRNLEESLIQLLTYYGIHGYRTEKLTGVWTAQGKIAAMGVHISRWITRHGFALNVNTNLSCFDMIVPCGIAGKGVCSMGSILSRSIDVFEVAGKYTQEFASVFGRIVRWISESELDALTELYACKIAAT